MPIIVKATGNEYKDLSKIKSFEMPLIVPLNFPKPYNFSAPFEAEQAYEDAFTQGYEYKTENIKEHQNKGVSL